MATLKQLTAQIAANRDVKQSALLLVRGLGIQLSEALAANDSVKLESLQRELAAFENALAAAVVANTQASAEAASSASGPAAA